MHGYAICRQLAEQCGESLELGEGTIYPLLHRLEEQQAIAAEWQEQPNGKPRKIYRITRIGRKMISAHQADWQNLMQVFGDVLGKGWSGA